MRYLLSLLIAFTCIAVILPSAHAAKTIKAAKPVKERLVLMPLRVPDEDKNLLGSMETALVQGMQTQYEVFSGEQVATKAKAIFLKESRATAKKECDETRCMQDIAIAFQAELIATANVTKRDGGYFMALSIQNIFDNKVVYSNSVACEGCTTFQVVNKLKELSGDMAQSPVASASIPPPVLPAPVITGNKNDPEIALWIEAQKGNSKDYYQIYLDSYPKGKYSDYAKASIKRFDDNTLAQQQQIWDTAQKENSVASYSLYLKTYPAGPFAGFAKLRLYKVEQEEEAKISANMVAIPGKNYEMGKYEVTQAEWKAVMGSNPSAFNQCGDTCPVEHVSWDDIQIFLQKLNAKSGRQYRLPTEAEWEYACYGGSQTQYCGSNEINAVAWYVQNSNNTTHTVGQKQANGYGLYDMSGNVWEWQSDCASGKGKCLQRGGSWFNGLWNLRAARRDREVPADRSNTVGFRLSRTLK